LNPGRDGCVRVPWPRFRGSVPDVHEDFIIAWPDPRRCSPSAACSVRQRSANPRILGPLICPWRGRIIGLVPFYGAAVRGADSISGYIGLYAQAAGQAAAATVGPSTTSRTRPLSSSALSTIGPTTTRDRGVQGAGKPAWPADRSAAGLSTRNVASIGDLYLPVCCVSFVGFAGGALTGTKRVSLVPRVGVDCRNMASKRSIKISNSIGRAPWFSARPRAPGN
jgi:hypothetical protein